MGGKVRGREGERDSESRGNRLRERAYTCRGKRVSLCRHVSHFPCRYWQTLRSVSDPVTSHFSALTRSCSGGPKTYREHSMK